jgi:hypothetical protein
MFARPCEDCPWQIQSNDEYTGLICKEWPMRYLLVMLVALDSTAQLSLTVPGFTLLECRDVTKGKCCAYTDGEDYYRLYCAEKDGSAWFLADEVYHF